MHFRQAEAMVTQISTLYDCGVQMSISECTTWRTLKATGYNTTAEEHVRFRPCQPGTGIGSYRGHRVISWSLPILHLPSFGEPQMCRLRCSVRFLLLALYLHGFMHSAAAT